MRILGPGVAVGVALQAACVPAEGPLMNPGSDCLSCHGGQTGARAWTVAGTLYVPPYTAGSPGVEGAHVLVTDANGRSFSLRTNRVGNFYTAEPVAFPLRICARIGGRTACMEEPVTHGSCNLCHGPQGVESPENHARLFPIGPASAHSGFSCVDCHAAGTAPAALACASCHEPRAPDLQPLHLVSTSDPEIVVSTSEFAWQSLACLRCHGDGQVNRTADHPSAADGSPPHEDAACTTCHDVYRTDKPWAADFATPPSSWPLSSGHGCYNCHDSSPPGG